MLGQFIAITPWIGGALMVVILLGMVRYAVARCRELR